MNLNNKSLVKEEWISEDEYGEKLLYDNVADNLEFISKMLGDSFDLIAREIIYKNSHQDIKTGIVVMEGLSDSLFVNQVILDNLGERFSILEDKIKKAEMIEIFEKSLLQLSNVRVENTFGRLINHILNGDTVLLIDGLIEFLAISSKGFKERAIEEPKNNVSVKGSKESFTESMATNVSIIRRRIRNPNLRIKVVIIGSKTNCNIAIVYMNGLLDEKVLSTLYKRLNSKEIESIVDSSYLKNFLKEEQKSVLPLIYDTERPDSVVGNLYEGRFAIIVDGSPYALIAPVTFSNFLTSVEDYYNKSFVGSALRVLRYIAVLISLSLPGLYMCTISFHSELLPINMVYSITGQRANVPIPAALEMILTIFAFDLLTEAGTRMPRAVGTALSFVGAIVIGQAAVEANLISSMMLIVVAINGIGTLLIPDYDMSQTTKFLRYLILFASLIFGLFGFAIASCILLLHMISLRSFGKPYLQPFAPLVKEGLLDTIFRAPLGKLLNRKKKNGKN